MSKSADAAYRYIRGEILSGALESGTQLREEHLAAACGVSRTPIREALRQLESEHFVRRNESQRTFVADWSLDETEEGFVLRTMLEGRAAARAADRGSEELICTLAAHNEAIGLAAKQTPPDVSAFLDHNRAFHATIMEMAASPRLAALLGTVIEQPIVWRTAQQYDQLQILQSHADHDEMIQAFRRRDPTWAAAVMTAHIRRAFHAYRDAFHKAGNKEREAAH